VKKEDVVFHEWIRLEQRLHTGHVGHGQNRKIVLIDRNALGFAVDNADSERLEKA
jgi:hypothetical protein